MFQLHYYRYTLSCCLGPVAKTVDRDVQILFRMENIRLHSYTTFITDLTVFGLYVL